MKHIKYFSLLVWFPLSLHAQLGQSPSEFSRWKQDLVLKIEKSKNLPLEESIPQLEMYIFKLNNQYKCGETNDLRISTSEFLTSIPGHAQYHQEKIENIRSSYLNGSESTLHGYNAAIAALGDLKYVQSPESVAVLGHFLNNPEGREGKMLDGGLVDGEDFSWTPPCVMAAAVLSEIGIDKPPSRGPLLGATKWQQIDAWKDWWNEIAAGKRTYRFIGSPVEYGANGPVSAKDLSRRGHDLQSSPRPVNVGTQEITSPPESLGIGSKVAAGVALALLAAGSWFAYGRRKGTA